MQALQCRHASMQKVPFSCSPSSAPGVSRRQQHLTPVRSQARTTQERADGWSPSSMAAAAAGAALAALAAFSPLNAFAVSGGGGTGTGVPLSFADLTGQDFRGKKLYKADLRGTNFTKADMEGANLFGAFAKDAKFTGAKLGNADLESVDFENADLSDAVLEGAQVTNAKFKNVTIAGSDWTDVVLRKDVQKQLCAIASGTNPVTGVDTKESLVCS